MNFYKLSSDDPLTSNDNYETEMVHSSVSQLCVVVFLSVSSLINGHGILFDPPGRNFMSEYGFDVPKNVDASGLNCGGQQVNHKFHNKLIN